METTKASPLRTIENFIIVWLDLNIDQQNSDFQDSITQFRTIINSLETFTNTDECADFLSEITDEKVFLIVSNALG